MMPAAIVPLGARTLRSTVLREGLDPADVVPPQSVAVLDVPIFPCTHLGNAYRFRWGGGPRLRRDARGRFSTVGGMEIDPGTLVMWSIEIVRRVMRDERAALDHARFRYDRHLIGLHDDDRLRRRWTAAIEKAGNAATSLRLARGLPWPRPGEAFDPAPPADAGLDALTDPPTAPGPAAP